MNRQSSSTTPLLLRPLAGLIGAVVIAIGVLDAVFETLTGRDIAAGRRCVLFRWR